MGLLKEVSNEQARAKVGAYGPQGSGKTTTLALLAIAVSKTYHGGAPVAMMDTENGSDFLKPIFDAEGVKLLVHKSGAFADMVPVLREAEKERCCAFIMDSVTHTWREIVESYCAKKGRTRMEFQDWKDVKQEWAKWTSAFLNSQVHCFVAGRAGYEYEYQVGDNGKKELIKGDTKMKAEGEFGYEPSLLIEMEAERRNTHEGHGGKFVHIASILKDRARALNGKQFEFIDINNYKPGDWQAIFKVFEPHFAFLNIGAKQRAIGANTSEQLFDANGDTEYYRRNKERGIALEEALATMQLLWPGQDVKSKTIRIKVLEGIWNTRAWSAVENLPLEKVQEGLDILKRFEERAKNEPELDTETGVLLLLSICKQVHVAEAKFAENQKAAAPKAETVFSSPKFDLPEVPKREVGEEEDEEKEITLVQMNGSIFLGGNGTFHIKEEIKKMGGRWEKNRRSWSIPSHKRDDLTNLCTLKQIYLAEDVAS